MRCSLPSEGPPAIYPPVTTRLHRSRLAIGLGLGLALALALAALPACGDDATSGAADTVADTVLGDDAGADSVIAPDTGGGADTATADTAPADDTAATGDDTATPLPESFGGERPAPVFYPADYDAATAWPLVILLHGYTASGVIQDAYLGFHAAATARGYVVLVPEGTTDTTGSQFWNADPSWCCNFYGSAVDDQSYLLDLVAEAEAALHIDPARVYLVGHSNGGFMAHRMACDHADVFAGVVSIAGSLPNAVSDCAPSAPVTVLQVHGTADAVIGYNGNPGAYPGALSVADRWIAYDGCDTTAAVAPAVDYDGLVIGDETVPSTWTGCDGGAAVALWTLTGSSHVPGFSQTFLPAVLDFLEAHERAAR